MPHGPASDLLPRASDVLPDDHPHDVRRHGHTSKPPSVNRRAITKANLKSLVCPAGKSEAFYWDSQVPGFGLRAYAGGKRVWLLQYRDANGKTRRLVLGDVKALDPERARDAARAQLTQKAIGNDPAAKRRADRKAARLSEIVDAYLAHHAQVAKASTLDQTRRNLLKYAARLHTEPVAAVDRAAVHWLHKALTSTVGPVQANRTLASLSAMFAWAMRAGLAKDNPAAFVPKNSETSKDRVLSDAELRAIWLATAGGGDFDRIVRLLLLTGCRRDEIGALRWSEISDNLITIPEARTKAAIAHEVPLSQLALEQLPTRKGERDYVFGEGEAGFSGWSRSKSRLDRRIERLLLAEAGLSEPEGHTELEAHALPKWALHDFRRTLSTRLNDAGTDPHIVEALLGHAGAKRGIAGVYNRASYRQQKAGALERWAGMVATLVEDSVEGSSTPHEPGGSSTPPEPPSLTAPQRNRQGSAEPVPMEDVDGEFDALISRALHGAKHDPSVDPKSTGNLRSKRGRPRRTHRDREKELKEEKRPPRRRGIPRLGPCDGRLGHSGKAWLQPY